MLLFGKKVLVFESRDEKLFKNAKKILKANDIRFGTSWNESEVVCGCGAKINKRKIINPNYSQYIWYIYVRPENEELARKLISSLQN